MLNPISVICATIACCLSPTIALTQEADQLREVIVWGRSLELLGNADSASQGTVGYSDFSTRPLARVGELVEVVSGMIATQHSGLGKANQ